MRKVLIIYAIFMSLFLVTGCIDTQPSEETTATPTITPTPTVAATIVPTSTEETTTIDIAIQENAFNPADVTIKVGDTVVWKNMDSMQHAVRIEGENSHYLLVGESFSHTFEEEGTFLYICSYHPKERGTIEVK